MRVLDTEFKEFILDAGLLSRQSLEAAEREATEREISLEEVLERQGELSVDELRRARAHILGVPFVDLKNERINPLILSIIPEPLSRLHQVVMFRGSPDTLEAAMLDLESIKALEYVLKARKEKVLLRLTDNESMKQALVAYQKYLQELFGDVIQQSAHTLKSTSTKISEETKEESLRVHAEHESLAQMTDSILWHALLQGATDVHIEPREEGTAVRYRLGTELHDAMILPPHTAALLALRLKHLGNVSIAEKILPQEGSFAVESEGRKANIHFSTLPTHFGEKVSVRVFKHGASGFTLEGLGLSGSNLETVHQALREKNGLIVVSGLKGSGKTTTLYTFLDMLNTPEKNIETIENSIEFRMNGVNQAEVREKEGFTALRGLKAILRQDADVIMIGELINELAPIAVAAAKTHLVIAGVTGNTRAYSDTASLVLNQRLVKRLGVEKEKYFLNKDEIKSLGQLVSLDEMLDILKRENLVDKKATWGQVPFWKLKSRVKNTDSGNIALFEVSDGETLIQDGIIKAAQGLVSIEEVVRAIMKE
jgi:type IV pilus assembly protein PilB